jgi:hypothetical protein
MAKIFIFETIPSFSSFIIFSLKSFPLSAISMFSLILLFLSHYMTKREILGGDLKSMMKG